MLFLFRIASDERVVLLLYVYKIRYLRMQKVVRRDWGKSGGDVQKCVNRITDLNRIVFITCGCRSRQDSWVVNNTRKRYQWTSIRYTNCPAFLFRSFLLFSFRFFWFYSQIHDFLFYFKTFVFLLINFYSFLCPNSQLFTMRPQSRTEPAFILLSFFWLLFNSIRENVVVVDCRLSVVICGQ